MLGTLIMQGLTLRPLLVKLDLDDDDPVGHEVGPARGEALRAALDSLQETDTPAAGALRHEYEALLEQAEEAPEGEVTASLRARRAAPEGGQGRPRGALRLRSSGEIGDDAFHAIEDELDRIELSVVR